MTVRKNNLAILLATSLLFAAPLQAQESEVFEKGVAAYKDGDYETAADLWAPLAEEGSPEAQRNLAQLYRLGLGVARDNGRAYELYAAAAEQNVVEAQVNAAFLLLTGEGIKKDPKQAALWFAKAADQGDALAQFNLGLMYEKGVGVPQDRAIARELYQLAANQGQERALARLDAIEASLPPDGDENSRDEQRGREIAEKAKKNAEERAARQQEADVKRVENRKAAEAAEKEKSKLEKAEAEAKTGPIMMMEKIEPKEEAKEARKTEPKAKTTTKEDIAKDVAAMQGDAPEAAPAARRKPNLAGSTTAKRQNTARTTATVPHSARVRLVRDAEAAYARGDFRTSVRLLIPLAQEGMPVAQFWLGRMFNRGEGVKLDRFEAYSLWRSAAASGSVRSATALANLSNRLPEQELARAERYHQYRMQRMAKPAN